MAKAKMDGECPVLFPFDLHARGGSELDPDGDRQSIGSVRSDSSLLSRRGDVNDDSQSVGSDSSFSLFKRSANVGMDDDAASVRSEDSGCTEDLHKTEGTAGYAAELMGAGVAAAGGGGSVSMDDIE